MNEPRLRTVSLIKRFGGLLATDEVSLEVGPSEIHALIGPNGAGKTTLIAQLMGELRSDSGQVLLDGKDITALGPAERVRRGISRTFQITQLLAEYTVEEHLILTLLARHGRSRGLWRPLHRQHEVIDAARHHLQDAGLAAVAGQAVAALSHGQRKQLELAIALAQQPGILLLDEPMAGLGPSESVAMTEWLARLRGSMPILLIEHDMDAVFALADRISVLVAGRCIASGPPDKIRQDEQVRQAYLGDGND